MKLLPALIFAALAVAVTAKHRKEWQRVDPMKASKERLLPIYTSSTPACTRGPGFYRDPEDCRQYIRCVDEFGTGRYFHIFTGRCDPGLVFDENISSCNWPEFAAPCSNAPQRLQEIQKPLKPEQVAQENVIPEETHAEKPFPGQQQVIQQTQDSGYHVSQQQQQQVIQGPQESGSYDQQQQEVVSWQQQQVNQRPEESDSYGQQQQEVVSWQQQQVNQRPEESDSYGQQQQEVSWPQQQQVIQKPQESGSYDPHQQVESWQQHVVHDIQIAAQEPVYQDPIPQLVNEIQSFDEQVPQQVVQENAQVSQQQNFEKEQGFEEPIQKELSDSFQKPINVQQQQVAHEEPIYGNQQVTKNPTQQQISSNGFQQVADGENHQFEVPTNEGQEQTQQQAQSQWWVSEPNTQHNPPSLADQIPASDVSDDPIFCSNEGFFNHPDSCSRFIRCVKIERGAYAVHFFECPKQLVFNERDSACVVADTHRCSLSQRKKRQASSAKLKCRGEGFFRHPEDCRSFYRCVKTETGSYETHLFSCPANLVFDEEYTTCNWPEKSLPCNTQPQQAQNRIKPAQSERTTYKPPTRTTSKRVSSTSKPRNDFMDKTITQETYGLRRSTEKPKSTTRSYYENAPKCRSQGFFKNENDCTKFFKCVKKGNNYIRYDLSCPNNFAFEDRSKRCIAQRYVTSCGKNKPPYPPRQDDEETTLSPETSSAESSNTNPPNSNSEDIVCEQEGYFRNPEDCNRFYRCVDFSGQGKEFVRYDFNCPEGLVFDETNSVCNWPDQSAPCNAGGGTNGNEGAGEDGGAGEDSGAGGNEVTEESGIGDDERGGDGEGSDDQDNSSSTPKDQAVETTPSSPAGEGNEGQGGTGNESDNSGSENECTKEGFYRNPEDCNKFYRCVDFNGEGQEFVRYDFACPEGLVFDEVNSVCNWPADSQPCDDTRSGGGGGNENENGDNQEATDATSSGTTDRPGESSENNESNQSTSPDPNSSTQGPSDGSSPSSSSETDATQSPTGSPGESTSDSRGSGGDRNSGECTEEGFFRNPEDCNKFYRCVDYNGDGQEFVKYDFTCPEGLVFDEANSVCNWPDQSAPCDNGSPGGRQNTTSDGDGSESSQTTTGSGGSPSEQTTSGSGGSSSEQTTAGYSSTESTTGTDERSTDSSVSQQSSTTEGSVDTSSGGDGNENTSDSPSGESGRNRGECTEAGFYRNPDDCGKFYRCVDFNGDGQQFVRYDFDCPDGLVFDEVNSVCNWPDQSPACETGGGSTGRETTVYDGGPPPTESSTSTEQSTQSATSDSAQTSSEQSTQSSTQQPPQTSTSQSSSERPTAGDNSECTESGFHRCQDDCNKFYRCVDENGRLVRYDFKCPDGLIFDDKNKKCDWPSSELTCDTDSSTSAGTTTGGSTTTAPTSQSESITQSTTASSTSVTSSATSSNIECTEEGFFRHPDDCSKYYRCLDEGDGTLTREDYSCAEDEVFDEEMRYCNRKDLAPPCDGSQTTSSQSQTTSTQSQTTASEGSSYEPQSTTERTTSSQPSTESSTKSSDSSECTQPGFFRCPEDCTKFYRCVEENGDSGNLVRYDFQCPDGLIFDERNNKCDWPSSNLTCDTDSSPTTQPSTTSGQTSGTTSSGTSGTTSSSSDSSSTSGTTSTSAEGCTEEGFFRNPQDCSKYYRCIDEGNGTLTREDYACAEDEVFDEEMRYCNRNDLAPPCDETSSSTTEGSSGSTTGESSGSTTEGSSGSTTQSSLEPERTTSSSGTTSGSSGSGECQEEGFHRDPNDCNKFYRCVDFRGDGQSLTRYDFDCPEGLVFDETNDVCNWPSSVPSCQSSGGSGSTSGGGSSTTSSGSDSSTSRDGESSTSSNTSGEQTSSTESSTSSTSTEEQSSSTSRDGSGISDSSTTSSSSEDSTTSGGSTTASGSTSSGDTGSTRGSSNNIECTEEGFFRHPEDCNKFYRCVDFAGTGESFVRYDFDCPEGLVFDEVNSVCNWPNQSPSCESGSRGGSGDNESSNTDSSDSGTTNSENSPQSTTSGTTDNSATDSQDSTDSTTSRDQTTASSSPGGATTSSTSEEFRCEEEGFFKHPSDCKKYYECKRDQDTGELVRIDCECPDGEVWDNEGWYCNAKELSPPCESSSSSFKCREEGFFRDPEDCTRYYQCNRTGPGENDFRKEQFKCEDGLVFDESGRYCNAPELSDPCDESSSTSSSAPGGDSSSTSSPGTGGDSSSTPNSGTSGGQGECTREGFFRNPEDCTKYYQCTRNEDSGGFDRNDHTCPDGRIFDEGSSYCNDPELSEEPCETGSDGGSTTSQQTTNTEPQSSDSGGSTTSQQTTSTEPASSDSGESGGTSPATGARGSGGDPQCTQEGFFRHPDDCNKFYRCVDFSGSGESFVRYDFDCPEGLHFDEVNSVCNWPTMTPSCEPSNGLLKRVLGTVN